MMAVTGWCDGLIHSDYFRKNEELVVTWFQLQSNPLMGLTVRFNWIKMKILSKESFSPRDRFSTQMMICVLRIDYEREQHSTPTLRRWVSHWRTIGSNDRRTLIISICTLNCVVLILAKNHNSPPKPSTRSRSISVYLWVLWDIR